jgi:hypothetical protein
MVNANVFSICSAQTRTGIGLLEKPPAVIDSLPSKASLDTKKFDRNEDTPSVRHRPQMSKILAENLGASQNLGGNTEFRRLIKNQGYKRTMADTFNS